MTGAEKHLEKPNDFAGTSSAFLARQRLQDTVNAERSVTGSSAQNVAALQPLDFRVHDIYPQSSSSRLEQTDRRISLQAGKDNTRQLTVDGLQRQYELHIPANYDGHSSLPVIYMMHGVGGSVEQLRNESGMNRLADEKGFAVVYVQALAKDLPGSMGLDQETSWNMAHGSLTGAAAGYDDVRYIRAVEQQVTQTLNVDADRKYIVGFSEGGGAAQYVAHEMPGLFAGVGSVHGTMLESDPPPRSADPTAFIAIHGDDDNFLPLHGGHGYFEGGSLLKGFMTMLMDKVSESEPLAQAPAWARAQGAVNNDHVDSKHNRFSNFSGGLAPVQEIIRHSNFHDWGNEGGQHAWDGRGQSGAGGFGWWAVGEPDPTQDTSRDIATFLLGFRKPRS